MVREITDQAESLRCGQRTQERNSKEGDDDHMSRDVSMSALMLQLAEVVTHLDLPGHRSPHLS